MRRAVGAAWLGPWRVTGAPPFGWVAYHYSLTFCHEIGHLFGALHNREVDDRDPHDDFSHGFLMGGGRRTIMAYHSPRHWNRIPYFSGPRKDDRGYSLGDRRNDNSRKHTKSRYVASTCYEGKIFSIHSQCRFLMAATGDESGSCPSGIPADCKNKMHRSNCEFWRGQGFCEHTHVSFMRKYCKKTCDFC